MASGELEQEVAFLSGVDSSGAVAGTSFWTWAGNSDPASYGQYSFASKWGGSTPGTAGGVVTYAFDPNSHWSAAEEQAFQDGLALWSAVADISFQEVANPATAEVAIRRGDDGSSFEEGGVDLSEPVGSHALKSQGSGTIISIDTSVPEWSQLDSFTHAGGLGIETVVHEEGHLLGLGHGGPYNFSAKIGSQQFSPYDSLLWSTMSYIDPSQRGAEFFADYPVTGTHFYGQVPATWMPADILAAQALYGAPASTPLSGGQVFGFHTNITGPIRDFFDFTVDTCPVVTLWDAGRGNTLDLSGFAAPSTVNLHAGAFSSADWMVNNIAIAAGTLIEAAIGGAGNDRIHGNAAANTLSGHAGADRIAGGFGADHLAGGFGADHLNGGPGGDVLTGGRGADVLTGGPGADSFVFDLPGVADCIVDFQPGLDRIDLDATGFAALGDPGPLAAAEFHRGWVATTGDQHLIYRPATGALLYDADGTGPDRPEHFATLAHHLALTAADFLVG
jgi:serralysin